jgi:hypothetical protein
MNGKSFLFAVLRRMSYSAVDFSAGNYAVKLN